MFKNKTTVIIRDYISEIIAAHYPVSSPKRSHNVLKGSRTAPSLTWEQYDLVNNELGRLNGLCQTLTTECESWKLKSNHKSSVYIEADTLILENERLSKSSRITELEAQIASLVQENHRLYRSVDEKVKQLEEWKIKHVTSEHYSSKVTVLTSENSRLHELVASQRKEIEELKMKHSYRGDYELRYQAVCEEKERLSLLLSEKSREIESLRIKFVHFDNDSHLVQELRSKIATLTAERERFNTMLYEKTEELEALRVKASYHSDYELKYHAICEEKDRLSLLLSERSKEIESLRIKFAHYEGDSHLVSELRSRISVLVSEKDKLTLSLVEKTKEIESYRVKVARLESEISSFSDLRTTIVHHSKETERLNLIIMEKEQEIQKLKAKYIHNDHMEHRVTVILSEKEKIQAEKDRLAVLLSEKTREIESLKVKVYSVEHFEKEKESMRLLVADRERVISELRSKIISYESDGHSISELKSRISMLVAENERLSHSLVEKTQEIDSLKVKVYSVGHFEKEKESMRLLVSDRERVIAELRKKIVSYESDSHSVSELKSRISMLVAENERLSHSLVEKTQEINSIRVKITQRSDFEFKWKAVCEERDRLSLIISEKTKEIDSLRLKIAHTSSDTHIVEELRSKVSVYVSENERLKQSLVEKIKIIEEWELKYHNLETLYLSIKEATHQLDAVRRKYEDAVCLSEKIEPRLKLSTDSLVTRKSLLLEKKDNFHNDLRHSYHFDTLKSSLHEKNIDTHHDFKRSLHIDTQHRDVQKDINALKSFYLRTTSTENSGTLSPTKSYYI